MNSADILLITILVVLAILSLGLLVGTMGLLIRYHGQKEPADFGIRQVLGLLDKRWHLERWFYRHHRPCGLIIITTAGFCAWQLVVSLPPHGEHTIQAVLLTAILAGQALNGAIGIMVLVRPSILKPIEARANRWHTTRLSGGAETSPGRAALPIATVAMVTLVTVVALIVRTLSAWMP
jgi:hypothetical protein